MNVSAATPRQTMPVDRGQLSSGVNTTRDAYLGQAGPALELIKPDPSLMSSRGVSELVRAQAHQARAGKPESIQSFFSSSKTVDGAVAESYAGIVANWAQEDGPGFVDRLGQAPRDSWRRNLELLRYADADALIGLSAGRPDGSGRPDGALAEAYAGVLSEMASENPTEFVAKLSQQGRQTWSPAFQYVGYANPSALVGLAEGKPDGAVAESYAALLGETAAADPAQFVRTMDGASRDSWRTALSMVLYANPDAFKALSTHVDGAIAEIYQQMSRP